MNKINEIKFQFNGNTYGLPDHFFRDKEGNISNIVFRQLLSMERKKFKLATNNINKKFSKIVQNIGGLKDEVVIALYSNQDFRRKEFEKYFKIYLAKLLENPSQGITQIMASYLLPNIEIILLDEFARDIFINSDLYIEISNRKNEYVFSTFNRDKESNISLSSKKVDDTLKTVTFRLKDKIKDWDTLLETERKKLSELVWALASLHDPEIFNECNRNYDGFSDYFNWLIELPINNEKGQKNITPPIQETPSELLDSEKAYCFKIIAEAEKGLESNSGEYIQNLKSLIDSLEKWVEDNKPKISLIEIIESWCQALFDYGKALNIPLYEGNDLELHSIFFNQWIEYFKSPAAQSMCLEDLNAMLEDRKNTAAEIIYEVKRFEEKLNSISEVLKEESEKISKTLIEKRTKQKRINELQFEIQSLKTDIMEKQDEAMIALMPLDTSVAIFSVESSMESPEFEETLISCTLKKALLDYYDQILDKSSTHSENTLKIVEVKPKSESDNSFDEAIEEKISLFAGESSEEPAEEETNDNDTPQESLVEVVEALVETENTEPVETDAQSELVEILDEPDSAKDTGIASDDENTEPAIEQTSYLEPVEIAQTEEEPKVESTESEAAEKEAHDGDITTEEEVNSESVYDNFNKELEESSIKEKTTNLIIIQFLSQERYADAYYFLKQLDELDVSQSNIDPRLIKGAYYGLNNWDSSYSLTKSQRLLSVMNPKTINEWQRQEGGEIVTYLALLSAFQPSLFGGNYTGGPFILSEIAASFDKITRQLIESTADLAKKNKFVNIDQLSNEGNSENTREFNPKERLDPWQKKILDSHRGYAPVLKAQKKCLVQGEMKNIIDALTNQDKSKTAEMIDVVEKFVDEMQSEEATNRLLEMSLKQAGQNLSIADIFIRERRGFALRVFELVDISKEWLSISKASHGTDVEHYCRKFTILLEGTINEFEARSNDLTLSMAHRTGAYITYKAFKRISRVVSEQNRNVAWNYKRAKAWFNAPVNVLRVNDVANNPFQEVRWLANSIKSSFEPRDLFEKALSQEDIVLAELMRLEMADHQESKPDDAARVSNALEKLQQKLINQTNKIKNQVENANLSALVGDSQAEKLDAELDGIHGEVDKLGKLTPTFDIIERLSDLENDISKRTDAKITAMKEVYKSQMRKLRSTINDNPVPPQWEIDIDEAFKDVNLPVITEMLDELNMAIKNGRRIQVNRSYLPKILKDFTDIENELVKRINELGDYKKIWNAVVQQDNYFGIDFSNKAVNLKKIVDIFSDFSHTKKPPRNLDKQLYDKIIQVLQFLGITPKDTVYRRQIKDSSNYTTIHGALAFYIEIDQGLSSRPFPIFGETGQNALIIIVGFEDWGIEHVQKLLSQPAYSSNQALFISSRVLSKIERNKFAHYFRHSAKTVLHIDLAAALFLGQGGGDFTENYAMRNFLWLTLPYTYYNPYVGGDTRYPPPREIRYGRDSEIDSLLQINNGNAIVFGGRQLGKSTILQEVHSRFHQPDKKQYAFYHHLDAMDRIDVSSSDWQKAEMQVWSYIYDDLYSVNLILTKRSNDTTPEMIQAEVKRALKENKDAKAIVIFDEIDPVLNVDNAHDFKLVRALRGPVNDPKIQGRFKIIIAGLESVKRFENSPNYPLPQLGGSIQISIMPTHDAIFMIKEPFQALGYTFESAQVVNRILAITNRHPGLIQIFCHELLKSLAVNQSVDIGDYVVTDDDITRVHALDEVKHLIRSRFEMTLNLDLRYLVIIYGLISEHKAIEPFSPREAKEISEAWLEDEFTKLSEKQFEAFLEEMVGLGVLRVEKEGLSNRYALRNTNVLKLLGSDGGSEVERQLDRAIREFNNSDPLDRHACFNTDNELIFSPITFRDEKEILGSIVRDEADTEFNHNSTKRYSVSIITGSSALGAISLTKVLPYLYAEDDSKSVARPSDNKYKIIAKDDDLFKSAIEFSNYLKDQLVNKSKERPIIIFINVTGNKTIADLLGILDAAHSLHSFKVKDQYPFRVIFYFTPKAHFQWLSYPDLTKDREIVQPFIKLGKWGKAALRYALDKMGMQSSTEEVDRLDDRSEGWYLSVDKLSKIKKSKKSATEIRDIEKTYMPMSKIKLSDAKIFYEQAGLGTFEWVSPLIREIIHSDLEEVTIEDLYLLGAEKNIFNENTSLNKIESMAIWMADMNLLKRKRYPNKKENFFSVPASVKHAVETVVYD